MNNIRLNKVSKKINENEYILKNINLQFEAGKKYCIYGPSGCGKTTLLNLIANIDNDFEGNIFYNGTNIKTINEIEENSYNRYIVNYIKQDNCLFNILTIKENIAIANLDSEINLAKEKNPVKIQNLSGGEYKRVFIQQILSRDCKVLLADEPTANLDERYSEAVMNQLTAYATNKIFIFVTHDINIAEKYADEIIYLNDGKCRKNYTRKCKDEKIIVNQPPSIDRENISLASKIFVKRNIKFTSLFNDALICLLMSITIMLSMFLGIKNYFNDQVRFSEDLTYIQIKQSSAITEITNQDIEDIQNSTGQIGFKKNYIMNDMIESYVLGVPLLLTQETFGKPNLVCKNILKDNEIILVMNTDYAKNIQTYLEIDDFDDILEDEECFFDFMWNNEIYEYNIADILIDESQTSIRMMHNNEHFYESFFNDESKYEYIIEKDYLNNEFISYANETKNLYIENHSDYYKVYKTAELCLSDPIISNVNNEFIPLYEDDESYMIKYMDGLLYFEDVSLLNKEYAVDNLIYYSPYKDTLTIGRYYENKNEICISSSLAEKLNIIEPQTIYMKYKESYLSYNVVGIIESSDDYIYQNPSWIRNINDSYIKDNQINNKIINCLVITEPTKVSEQISEFKKLYPEANITSPVYETISQLNTSINKVLNVGFIFISILFIITIFSVILITSLEQEENKKPIRHICELGYDIKDLNPIFKRILIKRSFISFILSTIISLLLILFINEALCVEMNIDDNIFTYNIGIILVNVVILFITLFITYNTLKYRKIKPKD